MVRIYGSEEKRMPGTVVQKLGPRVQVSAREGDTLTRSRKS